MMDVARTAVVDKTAQLGKDVVIGPGCVVAPGVVIGDGCTLAANVIIAEGVTMGANNRVFANCVLGEEPQIIGTVGPKTELIIGTGNVFRENVSINRGSPNGGGKTIIGNNNYLMIGSHLGHDCHVENNTVIGNNCLFSGHCKVESNVWLSALCGIHQFVTIGRFAYTAGLTAINADVPPFVRVSGAYPFRVRGLNTIGLQRAGFSPESIEALDEAYRSLYRRRRGPIAQALEEMSSRDGLDENVKYMLEFLHRSFQHRFGRYQELFRH